MNSVLLGLLSLTALPILAQTDKPAETIAVSAKKPKESAETGSRLGLSLAETPATVEVIDQEAIRERGDTSILEATEGGTGMTAGNPPGAPTIFSTRGFNGDNVTILFNGLRITNPGMSANPADTWNLAQVEILKGPASVLYGWGAVGGAVNFISKKPSRLQQSEALLSYGSFNKLRVGLGSGGPISDAVSYRVDVSRQSSDTYVDEAKLSYGQASGALQYDVNDRLTLALETDFLKDDVQSYFGTPLRNHKIDERFYRKNYNVEDNKTLIESNWIRLRADYVLSSDWKISNLAYRYKADRHWRNAEAYSYDEDSDLIKAEYMIEIKHDHELLGDQLLLQSTTPIGGFENNFLLGFEVSRNRFEHSNNSGYDGEYTVNPDHPENVSFSSVREQLTLPKKRTIDSHNAIFMENRTKFAPALQLVLGARMDQSEINAKHLNPNTDKDGSSVQVLDATFNKKLEANTGRVGLVTEVHPGLNLFTQYTNAQSSPITLVTLSRRNADFKLEKSDSVEAGLKHAVSDDLDYTLSVYQITKKDLFMADPANPSNYLQIGEQSSKGVEFAWSANLTRSLNWKGNMALLKARFEKFNEGAESYKGNQPTNVPEQVGNTWLTHDAGGIRTLLGLRYVGEQQQDLSNSYQFDSYMLLQAAITYKLSDYEITLRGKNLTDQRYVAWNPGDNMALIGEPRAYELALYSKF